MPYIPRGSSQSPAIQGPFAPPALDPFQAVPVLAGPSAPDDDASFLDLVSVNFRSESILGNLAETGAYRLARLAQDRVKDYDPMSDPAVMNLPPHMKALFEDSMSPGETAIILERIRIEQEWARILATEGLTGRGFVASMISQVPDMLMLHGIGVASNLANAPTLAGRVGRGAGIALVTETAQEAFKQAAQETRSAGQSAGNILGATVLGAGIPFLGTMARSVDIGKMGAKLDDIARRAYSSADDAIDGIKDELANPLNYVRPDAAAGTIASRVPFIKDWSPNFRVDKWSSPAMQKAQRTLLMTARILNKNLSGEASGSIEADIKFHYGLLDNVLLAENQAFEKYAGGYGKQVANLVNRTRMTRKEFSNAVSHAIRTGEHEIPEVLEAANGYRKLFAHFAKEMRDSGLADIADNERYLQRLYDYVKIRNDPAGWDKYISDALVRIQGLDPDEALRVARSVRETLTEQNGIIHGAGQSGPLRSRVFDLPDDVLAPFMVNDIREIAAHYTRYMAPRVELAKAARKAGITPKLARIIEKIETAKEDVDAALFEGARYPESFADSTGRVVDDPLAKEINSLMGEAAGADAFTRLEKLRLAEQIERQKIARDAININWLKDEVKADYDAAYRKAFDAGDTELANRINSEKLDALKELEASRQLILGAYGSDNDPTGVVSRLTRGVLAWNSMRLLGRVVLSQIPDTVVPVMKFGGIRTAKAAKALASGIRNDPELAGDLQLMRGFAGAIDTINNNRILEVSDMGGRYFERTAIEAGLERLSGLHGKLTGFNAWNDTTKQIAALSFSDYALRAARTVADGGKLKEFDRAFLASLGLGDRELSMLGRVSAHEANGLLMPDFSRWGGADSEVSRVYAKALRSAVDTTIVTPTLGQKALWTRTNWGKLMFQFKGYMQASMESIAGFMEQKWALGDRNDRIGVLLSTSAMIAAGGASYALKRLSYGKDLPSDEAELAVEAVDNSGVTGLFMELNNTVEKATRGNVGLRPALGVKSGAFRYSSRSPLGSMLGPAFTGAEDILTLTGKWEKIFGPEPMPPSMTKSMVRMIPLNNALFLNMAYDGIDAIGETVTGDGFLPGKPLRRFGEQPAGVP